MPDHEDHDSALTRARQRNRRLAAGIYRRARVDLGMTQAEAAERGHCWERSQRDRELGDCSLGALESLVALAASRGLRLRIALERPLAANDNDSPPSLRPVAKCQAPLLSSSRRVS